MDEKFSYKAAGVDIDAANRSVDMMRKWVGRTKRAEVMEDIGSFGGLFALNMTKFREPVLVSGTDGVGTKLLIAQQMGIHDTIGIDLVAMCVNDILVHGAEPLFFLDYIGLGKLKPALVEQLVKGVSEGCLQAGCALIGGETAEMPGFYAEDDYDLAGFAVGAVEKTKVLTGSNIASGDIILGIKSSGLHSNGYSLARKVLLTHSGYALEQLVPDLGKTLGEELLTPTRIYVQAILSLLDTVPVKGLAHITGGGIPENLIRILPEGCTACIHSSAWEVPPIFALISQLGKVEKPEMLRTFNSGIGMIVVAEPIYCDKVVKHLREKGEECIVIGEIISGERKVRIDD